jgi:putative tricarboxylic transport membrane protein
MMEEYLRRALLLSRGDWTTLVTSPISAGMLFIALAVVSLVLLSPALQRKREETFFEED